MTKYDFMTIWRIYLFLNICICTHIVIVTKIIEHESGYVYLSILCFTTTVCVYLFVQLTSYIASVP